VKTKYSYKKYLEAPAGKYFIGDPCYAVPDEDWSDVLDATGMLGLYASETYGSPGDKEDQAGAYKYTDKFGDHWILSAPTEFGDGTYIGSDGEEYGVDAGILGAVSLELALRKSTEEELKRLGSIVEFTSAVRISYYKGDVTIESSLEPDETITIQTGDYLEDDDWRSEDDGQPDEQQEWHDFDPDC
jgi:hypothetical protein